MSIVDEQPAALVPDFSPLTVLKKERDMIEHGRNELDQTIATAMAQRHSLSCLISAIDHELDRLRSLGGDQNVQLELPFDD